MKVFPRVVAAVAVLAAAGCSTAGTAAVDPAVSSTATVAGVPEESGPGVVCRYDHPVGGGMSVDIVVSPASGQVCYRGAGAEVPAVDIHGSLPLSPWTYDASTDLAGTQECNTNGVSVTVTGTPQAPDDQGNAERVAEQVCGDLLRQSARSPRHPVPSPTAWPG